jgi:hypothetical protein
LVAAAATTQHSSHLTVVHGSVSDPRFLRWLFLTHVIDDIVHVVVESAGAGGQSAASVSFSHFDHRKLMVQLAYLMHEAVLAKACGRFGPCAAQPASIRPVGSLLRAWRVGAFIASRRARVLRCVCHSRLTLGRCRHVA